MPRGHLDLINFLNIQLATALPIVDIPSRVNDWPFPVQMGTCLGRRVFDIAGGAGDG